MTPFPLPSQDATAEKSRMLQASALPATPSASAAEAEATPMMRTVRAVREDMDTIALRGMRNCGGFRGCCTPTTASPRGSQVYKRQLSAVNADVRHDGRLCPLIN